MKRKNIKEKVQEYFFLHPTAKLRVRQIEREAGMPLPSVIRYVRELEKEGMLQRLVVAGVQMYAADRTSHAFLREKRLFNLRQLFTSGLVDFLVEQYSNPPIVVFGSYAWGEDVEDSDIDLYIETPAKKKNIGLTRFERRLGRPLQLFIYRKIHEVENKELANNITNGVPLNGFVRVFA